VVAALVMRLVLLLGRDCIGSSGGFRVTRMCLNGRYRYCSQQDP